MLSDALEFLGVALLAAFLAFAVAWPYALLPVSIYLILTGYALDHHDDDGSGQ